MQLVQSPVLLRWSFRAGLVATLLTSTAPAHSRVEEESGYTKQRTYSAALRYLRVDLGYDVTERDPEAAYLLFEYVPTGQQAKTSGSIEIIENPDGVRIFIQLPKLPRYHEQVLSKGLLRKLREEYGEPPRRRKPDPAPKDDADADRGDSKEREEGGKQRKQAPRKSEGVSEQRKGRAQQPS